MSAKGLVAGEISFTTSTGDLIRAKDNPHGIIVPNNLSGEWCNFCSELILGTIFLKKLFALFYVLFWYLTLNSTDLTISTNAQFVLFVEKDATFQRLLDEKVFETLGPIILITGNGNIQMNSIYQ